MADIDGIKAPSKKKESSKKANMMSWLSVPTVILAVFVLIAAGAAVYFWQESEDAKSQTAEGIAERNREESERIIGQLDQVLLTESEAEPTVARIEDPSILQASNPEFYKNAQEGDYLVLYPQRAIIYRSGEKRVINVAPIIDASQLETRGTTPADEVVETEPAQ